MMRSYWVLLKVLDVVMRGWRRHGPVFVTTWLPSSALGLGEMAAGNLSLMSWWKLNSERDTLDVLSEKGFQEALPPHIWKEGCN